MKTMKDYTNYCTEDQTIRAYRLGAPIVNRPNIGVSCSIPTTQQMINWLLEQGIIFNMSLSKMYTFITPAHFGQETTPITFGCYEEGNNDKYIIAAIDAALGYLEKGETV